MSCVALCFFFNDTATTEIYTYGHTLSLHDALPICQHADPGHGPAGAGGRCARNGEQARREVREHRRRRAAGTELPLDPRRRPRSEEHTSELQSLMRISYAVFCLKKKKKKKQTTLTNKQS